MSHERTELAPAASRRYLPIVLGVAAIVAAGVALVFLFMPADDEEAAVSEASYSAEIEAVFVASCIADGGEPVRPVCECFYDGIVEAIPYDRYQQVNELLLAAPPASGDPISLPDDFEAILTDCRRNNATS